MSHALENVSDAAVGIGLAAWIFLAAYMAVQAILFGERRGRYALFAGAAILRAGLDLGHAALEKPTYELTRLLWLGLYLGACLWLLDGSSRRSLAFALAVALGGILLWTFGNSAAATTIAFPAGFAIIALAFAGRARKSHGYASSLLCACFAAMAILCTSYYPTIVSGDSRIVILGYSHMALLNAMAVLLGWIHLPRELAGRAPVRVKSLHTSALVLAAAGGEIILVLGLCVWVTWPPILYLLGTGVLVTGALALFFHQRHLLVIYADDVTALLDERTASLRAAREELARLNAVQAQQLEEQARELQTKAEVIERQRRLELAGQTAGQAAHDLQNLLIPMLAEADRLEKATETQPGVHQIAEGVRRRLEHILQVSAQMLTLGRRGQLEVHPISLLDLVRDAADQFGETRPKFLIEEEVWIQGAWSQVSRAVLNLIQNAQEADPSRQDGVAIRVRSTQVDATRRCHLGFLEPGPYAAVDVLDSGPGVPPAILERIFEPFFSAKTGKPRSGSGLGLAIVNSVAQDHRAVIDLQTGPAGSCFTLYFPLIEPPIDPRGEEAMRGQGVVLLADDDPGVRRRYAQILRNAGYSVVVAQDGREAMDTLRSIEVDILLLDLKMPLLGGSEVLQGVIHHSPATRVIVHSGYLTGEEAANLRASGVAAVLAKPSGRDELLKTVRAVLDAGWTGDSGGGVSHDETTV